MPGSLTDTRIKSIKPEAKPLKFADGGGLYLYVSPAGGKLWRVDYRFNGKRRTYSLGKYPAVSLKDAREGLAQLQAHLANGIDPAEEKKREKQQVQSEILTYRGVAEDWFKTKQSGNTPRTASACLGRINKHILPAIGQRPYHNISFEDLRQIVRGLENSGKFEMARRVAQILNQVGKHAKLNRWSEQNNAEGITEILQRRPIGDKQPRPAITEHVGVAEMLRKIEAYCQSGRPAPFMQGALRLFPLLGLRGTELLGATWDEVDFEKRTLTVPGERMKIKSKSHTVYLATQTVEIFRMLAEHKLSKYVFPAGGKLGHLTVEGVNNGLHRAGIPKGEHCNHGWRSVLSTLAHGAHATYELVEIALAHNVGNEVSQAYNRARYEADMRYFFQWWADYLCALRDGEELPVWDLSRAQ